MKCTLCNNNSILYSKSANKEYYKCSVCGSICMHPLFYISSEKEKIRYQEHNNDVNDIGYQNFVNPIIEGVITNFNNKATGLDFGCGTGPVITKLLREKNFNITTYDPFFDNNFKALKKAYDFIVCCEVIEHFHHPLKEFKLLKSLLKPKGKLYCMTDIFSEAIDFNNWYYKNDNTHVIFYQENTFKWIQKYIGFSKITINNRLIIFEN